MELSSKVQPFIIMKIRELIQILETEAARHGDIDVQIEVALPDANLPKENSNHYYHMFGYWGLSDNGETLPVCHFQEDKEFGNTLFVKFNGQLDGEVVRLSAQDLKRRANLVQNMA